MVNVGKWSFIGGVIVAILAGFYPDWTWVPIVLIILGLIVGFLNIGEEEVDRFLIASIALLVIGTASINALFSAGSLAGSTQAILNNIISFISAAALVVALKSVIALGGPAEKK